MKALEALVGSPLADFLTPQLPALLTLLLRQPLLACAAPAVAEPLRRVLAQVPRVVPARLLLPALTSQLDATMLVCQLYLVIMPAICMLLP